jgi:hypothetical protein
MITRRRVDQVATESGFRSDSVEKVLRLSGILGRLDRHPTTSGVWLLKGGTALNLLHLNVPRMSMDIDLNYVGAASRERMLAARPDFEAALVAVCEREGCTVKRTPDDHAGGKFRLRFVSVLGGSQNLEVDVSYVARVPLLATMRLATRFPSDGPIEVPTLSLLELAAGKFTALVQRTVVRDAFDAANLLQMVPGLLEDAEFRLAFVCSIAGGRHDPRELSPPDPVPAAPAVKQQLIPMLQQGVGGSVLDPEELREQISRRLVGAVERLLSWSPAERRFLDRLHDEGVVDAEALHADPVVRERIRTQPMLLWKAQNVRKFRQGHP